MSSEMGAPSRGVPDRPRSLRVALAILLAGLAAAELMVASAAHQADVPARHGPVIAER